MFRERKAETGTITEAANKLYISQPSLTNAIHELEKEMNMWFLHQLLEDHKVEDIPHL